MAGWVDVSVSVDVVWAVVLVRFRPPLQVTTAAFDPHSATASGKKHGAWWIGDYQGITASAGAFHLV
jgi:hypothetical protein